MCLSVFMALVQLAKDCIIGDKQGSVKYKVLIPRVLTFTEKGNGKLIVGNMFCQNVFNSYSNNCTFIQFHSISLASASGKGGLNDLFEVSWLDKQLWK